MKRGFWKGGMAVFLALALLMSFPLVSLAESPEADIAPPEAIVTDDTGLEVQGDQTLTIAGWQLGDGFVDSYTVETGGEDPSAGFPGVITGVLADETTVDLAVVWTADAAFSADAAAVFTYTASAADPLSGYVLGQDVQWPAIRVEVAEPAPEAPEAPETQQAPEAPADPSEQDDSLATLDDELSTAGRALNNAYFVGDPKVYLNNKEVSDGDTVTLNDGDTIRLDYVWERDPNDKTNILKGDTAVLGAIPGDLPVANDFGGLTRQVKTTSGIHIGDLSFEAVYDASNTLKHWNVILTYTDNANMEELRGTFSISSTVSKTLLPGQTLPIEFEDGLKFEFEGPAAVKPEVEKKFDSFRDASEAKIEPANADNPVEYTGAKYVDWKINLNTKRVAVENAVLVDNLSSNMEFDTSYTKYVVSVNRIEDGGGKTLLSYTGGEPKGEDLTNPTYTVVRTTAGTITFSFGDIKSEYEVVVRSKINAGKEPTFGSSVTYYNTATLNGVKASTSKTVNLTNSAFQKVKGTATLKDGRYYTSWTLHINKEAQHFGKSIIVKDDFGKVDEHGHQIFEKLNVDNSQITSNLLFSDVKLVEKVENVTDNATEPHTNISPVRTTDGIQFTVPGGKYYKITLNLLIDETEGLYCARNKGYVTNSFTAEVDSVKVGSGKDDLWGGVGGNLAMTKEIWKEARDTTKQELGWILKLGAATDKYDLKNLVITDTFTYGINGETNTLDASTIEMTLGTSAVNWEDYFELTSSDTTGFVLTQHSNATIPAGSGQIVIKYKTIYTLGKADDLAKTGVFNNDFRVQGELHWGPNPTDYYPLDRSNGPKTQTVYGDAKLSGYKKGTIDKGAQGYYADWEIYFNTITADLSGHKVTLDDVFDSNGGMVFNTTKGILVEKLIAGYWDDSNTDPKNWKWVGDVWAPLTPDADYKLDTVMENNNTGFELEFLTSVKTAIRIQYRTDLKEPVQATYINTATVAADDVTATATAEVKTKRADDSDMEKSLAITGTKFDWEVKLGLGDNNTVLDGVFTDTLSAGQILDKTSIEVYYDVGGNPGSKYTNYTIEGGDRDPATATTTFKILFPKLEDKVIIKYTSTFDEYTAERDPDHPQNHGRLSNSARFTGTGYDKWTEVVEYYAFSSVDASGTGSLIPVRIQKLDGLTGAPLAGAEFQVYDLDGKEVGMPIILNTEGKSGKFTLLGGTYVLKEIKTPDGYKTIDPVTFTVSIEKKGDDGVVWLEVKNDPFAALRIRKLDGATGKALAGAEFQVYNQDGNEVGKRITLDKDGLSEKLSLPDGTYTLKETKTPAGYKGIDPITFTVSAGKVDKDGVIWLEVKNYPLIPVRIQKLNGSTGKALTGAEFQLYDTNDQPIGGVITLDSKGQSEKIILLEGTYVLKETKTPKGFKPIKPITFTVSLDQRDNDGVIWLKVKNYPKDTTPDPDPDPDPDPTPDPDPDPDPPRRPVIVTPDPDPPRVDPDPPAPTPAVVTNPPVEPAEPEEEIIPPEVDAGAGGGPDAEDLSALGVPLGGLNSIAWSLLNLMMSIVALLASLILIFSMLKRKKTNQLRDEADAEAEDEKIKRNRLLSLRIITIVAGIIPGVLFLILENIRLPMVWITRWTPLIGAFFIISMALVIIHFAIKVRAKNEDDQDGKSNYTAQTAN